MTPSFVPELSHVVELDGTTCFATIDGVVGVALSQEILDVESANADQKVSALLQSLQGLPDGVLLRVHSKVAAKNELPFNHARRETLLEKGFIQESIQISFEKQDRGLAVPRLREAFISRHGNSAYERRLRDFVEKLPLMYWREFGARSLTKTEVYAEFDLGRSVIEKTKTHLETATDKIRILRLEKQIDAGEMDQNAIDEFTLAELKRQISPPFELSVTLRKIPKTKTNKDLRLRMGKKSNSNDPTAGPQAQAAADAIARTALGNDSILEMEWLLVLRRSSEEALSTATKEAHRVMERMGDIKMEGVGGKNSFAATRLGAPQHYPIQEYANNAWAFLPLFSVGEPAPKEASTSIRTLFLHRQDDSLFGFDGYARAYAGCNILINGRRGSGKSVLANLISNAMLQDPSVRLIGFDVGGSYRKECSRFGGTQIDFKMDAPSGLNPFKILTEYPDSNDVVLNLSGFLGPLIAEKGDGIVPESTQADLERKLKAYAATRPATPSLSDFLSKSSDTPGRSMLERWTEGVYENAFRETDQSRLPENSRYTYFNLEHIHSATNKTYLRGIFGALIAHANNEMMKAGDARSKEKVRLFTRGDEVPFVTEIPGGAFYLKQLTANARKFDQGTMLIAQSLKSLVFRNSAGELDRGIIINSPIRCFFEIEGSDDEFELNFDGANERRRSALRNLYRGQNYRECMIQTPNAQGGFEWRLVKIQTRSEEYWDVTSSDEDNRKLFGLMRNVPGLTLEEAIGCLSLSKR